MFWDGWATYIHEGFLHQLWSHKHDGSFHVTRGLLGVHPQGGGEPSPTVVLVTRTLLLGSSGVHPLTRGLQGSGLGRQGLLRFAAVRDDHIAGVYSTRGTGGRCLGQVDWETWSGKNMLDVNTVIPLACDSSATQLAPFMQLLSLAVGLTL